MKGNNNANSLGRAHRKNHKMSKTVFSLLFFGRVTSIIIILTIEDEDDGTMRLKTSSLFLHTPSKKKN